MVLWEITLATAYFLGLKRTYRIALKLQRRLIKRPRIRNFFQRRTRLAFDVALSVHKKVQQRDLEVGRSLGNWMLRWLDRMKPSAQIRSSPPPRPLPINSLPKHTTSAGQSPGTQNHQHAKNAGNESNRRLFSSTWTVRPKYFPTVAMVMQPPNTAGVLNQYRHICNRTAFAPEVTFRQGTQTVFRKDIEQWMWHN